MFFTGSTNPPNQYYQTVLQLTNMADLDRFDIVIPFESRLGINLFEITEIFAESKKRRSKPQINFKIDISNIDKIRRQIFSIPIDDKSKSMISLFGSKEAINSILN